ncbi:MAG: hypothetical protein LBJ23_04405 [Tannerella sp.]|nr:hypothetical protein [Tannerella sp.]
MGRYLSLFLCMLLFSAPAFGQVEIRGAIVEQDSREPVEQASERGCLRGGLPCGRDGAWPRVRGAQQGEAAPKSCFCPRMSGGER